MRYIVLTLLLFCSSAVAVEPFADGLGAKFFASSETRLDGLAYSDDYGVGGEIFYGKGSYFGGISSVRVDNIEEDGKQPDYLTSLNFGRRGDLIGSVDYAIYLEGSEFQNGENKRTYVDTKLLIVHHTSWFAYGIAGGYSPDFHGLYGHAVYGKGFIATKLGDMVISTSYGRVGTDYEFGDITAEYPILSNLKLSLSYNAVGSGDGIYEEIDDDSVSGKISLTF